MKASVTSRTVFSKSKAIIEDSDEEAEGSATATDGNLGLKRKIDEQEEGSPAEDLRDLSNGESKKRKKHKHKKHKKHKEDKDQ